MRLKKKNKKKKVRKFSFGFKIYFNLIDKYLEIRKIVKVVVIGNFLEIWYYLENVSLDDTIYEVKIMY